MKTKIGIRARSADAMRSLEMMGLARRAEATLIEAGLEHGSSISVLEPGRIQLTGIVTGEMIKTKAEKILTRVRGIQSIDNQVQVVTPYPGGG